jgi:hypothetical protein
MKLKFITSLLVTFGFTGIFGLRPSSSILKPGIDCARLPREAVFVALPRKVDTMLPRAAERTLPRVEPNRSGYLSRGKGISVCRALSVVAFRCFFRGKWRMKSV